MILRIDDENWFIDKALLRTELYLQGHTFVSLSDTGELVIRPRGGFHNETWQARPDGHAWKLAGMCFKLCHPA